MAAIQLRSTTEPDHNLRRCEAMINRAVDAGAEFILLPENFAFLGPEEDKLALAAPLNAHPLLAPLQKLAAKHKVAIVAGGLPEAVPTDLSDDNERRTFNTSVLLGKDGQVVKSYRKIHLFDIDAPGRATHRESRSVKPGEEIVSCDCDGWRLGFSICYDLRFPELYRALADTGVEIITVPAAFTLHTGKDHWGPLLRARAIENQAYVIAAGQFGRSGDRFNSWGKSMVIDPWGTVLCTAPEDEAAIIATIDKTYLKTVRAELPALTHRCLAP